MAEQTCPCCGANLRISCNTAHPKHDCYHPDGHERPQPDWADLREMARNAGWTLTTTSRQYGVIWWSNWKYLAPDERGLVSIAYHSIEGWGFTIVNRPDDVSLQEPTPAKVLAAARLVGLGGAS